MYSGVSSFWEQLFDFLEWLPSNSIVAFLGGDPNIFYGLGAAILIIALVLFDWSFKWIAYQRLDSVFVDACIFSTVHSLFHSIITEHSHRGEYLIRFFANLALSLWAVITHRKVMEQTEDRIRNVFKKKIVPNSGGKSTRVWWLWEISQLLFEPDLLKLKSRKNRSREVFIALAKEMEIDEFDTNALLLHWLYRLKWIFIFTIGAFASILVAAVPFKYFYSVCFYIIIILLVIYIISLTLKYTLNYILNILKYILNKLGYKKDYKWDIDDIE